MYQARSRRSLLAMGTVNGNWPEPSSSRPRRTMTCLSSGKRRFSSVDMAQSLALIPYCCNEVSLLVEFVVRRFLAGLVAGGFLLGAAFADGLDADLGDDVEEENRGSDGQGGDVGGGSAHAGQRAEGHLDGVFALEVAPFLPLGVEQAAGQTKVAAGVAFVFLPESLERLARGALDDGLLFGGGGEFGAFAGVEATESDQAGSAGLQGYELLIDRKS